MSELLGENSSNYQRLLDSQTWGKGMDIAYTRLNDHHQNSSESFAHWSIIRIPFRNLARATVSLPLGGFIFIVLWAMATDLESATYTHCGVSVID